MKKYLLLGLIVLILGMLGARVWFANSSEKCEELKGMKAEAISADELQRWISPDSDTVSETGKDIFYVQEAIGSEGFELIAPRAVDGDFILKFDFMSLTRQAMMRFNLARENSTDIYALEISTSATKHVLKVLKNQKILAQSETAQLKPDVFYPVQLEKIGKEILFVFNHEELFKLSEETPGDQTRIIFEVNGAPDNPAAIEIKNMKLFSN